MSDELNSSEWTIENSAELYGINSWGAGYFKVNDSGNLSVTPMGPNGPRLDLRELINDLMERGIRVPMLIRFPDIFRSRIELLSKCFSKAMESYGYKGSYCGVYPIKVNQQRHVVEELLRSGQFSRLGLECGSKPELLVALALVDTPNALIICNGFKDQEYIETAILSQKLGRNTIIVVDRYSELPVILEAAKKYDTKPRIGFRAKLNSRGAGKWVESSGARSKFGLTPTEMVEGVELLKAHDRLDCLELFHFHIGSQITSIQSVKSSLKEGTRFFSELHKLGGKLQYFDVGGGLGVDYDGSGNSDSSTNYSEQEYANDVVSIIQDICDEKGVPHPTIVTESGRSLVAHHSLLVFNILGANRTERSDAPVEVKPTDHHILRSLSEICRNMTRENINEFYHDLQNLKVDILQLFKYGVLSLEQLAKAENLYWTTATKMRNMARNIEDADDIVKDLDTILSDTYYCNFSVFQSLPDSWAVGQVFPLIPLQRLNEEPKRRATLVDLTCDSDGKIEKFISNSSRKKTALEVHDLNGNEPYFMGIFLVGAYQEILGDFHNLFGDTDAVHITMTPSGYAVDHVVKGDSVSDVLGYVEYQKSELIENIRRVSESGILRGTLTKPEARLLMKYYEDGLSGYTYLEEPE
ncbi:MAG: arginine decarboxylase [Proteobacteria bacterium SG_bin7]|nr:MAG: arginine decarboxylase [Proteobacteria bacterium SG_bin7]